METVLISGGDGLLAKELKKCNPKGFKIVKLSRKKLDTSNRSDTLTEVCRYKPDIFIHCGAMTTPMKEHEDNPYPSIRQNIVGTANVALACLTWNVKQILLRI